MTKIEKDLNLMLLKLCEEILPKTKVAEDAKIVSAMKKVRQYLEGVATEGSDKDRAK
jgi:hypothetical protein